MTQVWQIAAGTSERNYTDLFLNHDIVFMGPGNDGDYHNNREIYEKKKLHQVRAFAQDVRIGDIILARIGHSVSAIGLVDETGYEWSQTFDDVFGWDLQHTRRVIWQDQLDDELTKIQAVSNGELFSHMPAQMPTISRTWDKKVLARIDSLISRCEHRPLRQLPDPLPDPLEMEQVGEGLFSKGLSNDAVDKVLQAIQRQRRLLKWYEIHGAKSKRPTEHEVVAHMVLPLLLALGWSEQLLALEWHKIDLAAFRKTPTTKDDCILVCEAKGLGRGLQNVFEQAKIYAEKLELHSCHKVLLTDGARLYLYERKSQAWSNLPVGYLNVNLIRTRHIAPKNTNAIETIMALTPSGIIQKGDD